MTEMEIGKHMLVPLHEIMGEDEAKEILGRYSVSKRELPRILGTDPVVREIGAKIGDVICIRRNSPIAGDSCYYRVVVDY